MQILSPPDIRGARTIQSAENGIVHEAVSSPATIFKALNVE
jgi:hypothetical protein